MTAQLHLFCGMIAAGKSTLAREIASAPGCVLISQDSWLDGLYPGEIRTLKDFIDRSAKLQQVVGPHVTELLANGLSVALDFAANTVELRRWMRGLADSAGTGHQLHLLEADDALCKARMHARNAEGKHEFAPDDATYDAIKAHFSLPDPAEGLTVIRHPQPA